MCLFWRLRDITVTNKSLLNTIRSVARKHPLALSLHVFIGSTTKQRPILRSLWYSGPRNAPDRFQRAPL